MEYSASSSRLRRSAPLSPLSPNEDGPHTPVVLDRSVARKLDLSDVEEDEDQENVSPRTPTSPLSPTSPLASKRARMLSPQPQLVTGNLANACSIM